MSQPVVEPAATPEVHGTTRHPRGLSTLFFTEMWERFSYYGMRGLLVLFMTYAVRGGLGYDDQTATAIYGLYTAAVYLAALPGGWIADRLMGDPAPQHLRPLGRHCHRLRPLRAGHTP